MRGMRTVEGPDGPRFLQVLSFDKNVTVPSRRTTALFRSSTTGLVSMNFFHAQAGSFRES